MTMTQTAGNYHLVAFITLDGVTIASQQRQQRSILAEMKINCKIHTYASL